MSKTAFITGITGQDGSYLAELLLQKGYQVIGFVCENNLCNFENIKHLINEIELVSGDLVNAASIDAAIKEFQPDEVYNLAAFSHPGKSWDRAVETGDITGLGAHRLFDIIKSVKQDCRIYQASSSEIFGAALESPQTENTPLNPVNPYAVAKAYAHNISKIYRRSLGMFISCGILFNHESPRRGLHFITQKVAYGAACIKLGIKNSAALNENDEPIVKNGKLLLGNLEAKRDWGFAGDYVEAMWLMLQQSVPDDFVIGTGVARTIKQLCEEAFSYVELNWEDYVSVDTRLVRLAETESTIANANKAKEVLGWQPKTSFKQLVNQMVEHNLNRLNYK